MQVVLVNVYFYKHSNNLYYFNVETKVIVSPSKQVRGFVWLINVTCLYFYIIQSHCKQCLFSVLCIYSRYGHWRRQVPA